MELGNESIVVRIRKNLEFGIMILEDPKFPVVDSAPGVTKTGELIFDLYALPGFEHNTSCG